MKIEPAHILANDGLPVLLTVERSDDPTGAPRSFLGLGITVTPAMAREALDKARAKMEALAVLTDGEVPEEIRTIVDSAEIPDEDQTSLLDEPWMVCWN